MELLVLVLVIAVPAFALWYVQRRGERGDDWNPPPGPSIQGDLTGGPGGGPGAP